MITVTRLALAVLLLAQGAQAATPAPPRKAAATPTPALHAGPMLGYTALREASVWVQTTGAAEVTLRYWPEGAASSVTPPRLPGPQGASPAPLPSPQAAARGTITQRTTSDRDFAATFVLSGLEPGTRYAYEIVVDGKAVPTKEPRRFSTQPLWQWRTQAPDFTAMIGSCLYVNDTPYDRPGTPYGSEHEILLAMAAQKPDLMIWLGDNTYTREVDYDTPAGLRYRYRHDRALPELQPLLAAAPHYATWDDHDFGPNDSDGSFALKEAALGVFTRYWPAPSYGMPGTPGVFQKFAWSDVDFFLLDDRYHRKPNAWPAGPDRRMLGLPQMRWLQESLVASRATFKVVVLGNQVVNPLPGAEALTRFPVEYNELVDFLRTAKVEGVLFLSGDVHHTELMKVQPEGLYPLYDFTSSPLTAGTFMPRTGTPEFDNPARLPGTLLGEHSFGTLRVEGARGARRLILRAHDKAGAVKWTHTIERAELAFPK
jgi:alkaline phosphatase D